MSHITAGMDAEQALRKLIEGNDRQLWQMALTGKDSFPVKPVS